MLKQNFTCGFSNVPLIALVIVVLLVSIGLTLYLTQGKPGPGPSPTPTPTPSPTPTPTPTPTPVPAGLTAAKRLIQPEDIVSEKVDVVPQIPAYPLPLSTDSISNYQEFSKKIDLSPEALSLLRKNGFVAVSTPSDLTHSPDDFANYYSALKERDIPIFITSDSLLHYYHIFFDTTLMKLERDLFYDDVWQISKELLDDASAQYNSLEGDLKEAAKRNVAYLSVALELLRPKDNQVVNDDTLKEEYCRGTSGSWCDERIEDIKRMYGDKASFKYFSEEEFKEYNFKVPDYVDNVVKKELALIEKHEGWEFSPIFIYKEDYSQYVPRGHYAKSEKLKNYFKALTWYGRMTALIKGSPVLQEGESQCTGPMSPVRNDISNGVNGIVSEYDAKIQTLGASLIADKFSNSQSLQERWQRIYAITAYFVGFSDDLGPYEYRAVLKDLREDTSNFAPETAITQNYSQIKDSLSALPYSPKIYGGLGACELSMPCPPLDDEEIQELKVQAKELLEETKGFRLMGQRFTVDSWLFSETVSPYSGEYTGEKLPLPTEEKPFTFYWNDSYATYRDNRPFTWVKTDVKGCPPPAAREVRGFPRGLDIMAFFGSDRAKAILEELGDADYSDYQKKFTELKSKIDAFSTDDWFQNLYWNWLYVLKGLLGEFGEGYQAFMQTTAWQDKGLNTALASWAELRHDTILYVKQSYTMAEIGAAMPSPPVVGYVEPVPEFYARLLTLTEMTNKGLANLVPQEELEELRIKSALNQFADILERLLDIAKKELENKPLTDEEYRFIEHFGDTSEHLIAAVSGGVVQSDILKTVLIGDVHTDGNTEKVLEEGVGYIKTLVVAYKMPQGHILVGAGPVFSYYEFKQPMDDRLTDEAWRVMLDSKAPAEPEWLKSFSE